MIRRKETPVGPDQAQVQVGLVHGLEGMLDKIEIASLMRRVGSTFVRVLAPDVGAAIDRARPVSV